MEAMDGTSPRDGCFFADDLKLGHKRLLRDWSPPHAM
jgi:hypothetical protein